MPKATLTNDDVKKIAKLANLTLQVSETNKFADQFTQTIQVVNELSGINTEDIFPTYQVNNLQNITREDVVATDRVLPQDVAIREAKHQHNGYIVVERIIDNA